MKKSQVEEQILRAAEELFMEKGFDAVSTTDIARKVGCNQALVHYYFRTKDNLFLQVFLHILLQIQIILLLVNISSVSLVLLYL